MAESVVSPVPEQPEDSKAKELAAKAEKIALNIIGLPELAKDTYLETLKEEDPNLFDAVVNCVKNIHKNVVTKAVQTEAELDKEEHEAVRKRVREAVSKAVGPKGVLADGNYSIDLTTARNLLASVDVTVISQGNPPIGAAVRRVASDIMNERASKMVKVIHATRAIVSRLDNEPPGFIVYDAYGKVHVSGYNGAQNNARDRLRRALEDFDKAIALAVENVDYTGIDNLSEIYPDLLSYPHI